MKTLLEMAQLTKEELNNYINSYIQMDLKHDTPLTVNQLRTMATTLELKTSGLSKLKLISVLKIELYRIQQLLIVAKNHI